MLPQSPDGAGSLCDLNRWGLKFSTCRSSLGARDISDSVLLEGCCSVSPGVECATYEMKVKSWNMGTLNNRSATELS